MGICHVDILLAFGIDVILCLKGLLSLKNVLLT